MEKKKFEQKNGTGVLFTNNKRETEKHPTMTGKIVTPDGVEYRISAWTKEGANGKYLSLALSDNKEFTKEKKESNTPFNDLPF